MTDEVDLTKLPLAALKAEQDAAADGLQAAKARVAGVASELARRYGDSAKAALQQASKTHGSFTLPLQDGLTAKGDVKQSVSWDSEKLMEIASSLPWERVRELFNVKFSMTETVYKGVGALNPEFRDKIDDARTVRYGEPSIVLQAAE